jgi:hypothetical protein
VAAVVIIVVLILIILGIHSCQVSSRNSALKDYNNSVNSIMTQSIGTRDQLFSELSGSGGAQNAASLQQQINQTQVKARTELQSAAGLSVPSQVSAAQQKVIFALQMRLDGITGIGNEVQPALNATTSRSAVDAIALDIARFYTSDVTFLDYAEPEIASALNSTVGHGNWTPYSGGQFLPSLNWLSPTYIASKLGASLPQSPTAKCVSGQLVGNALDSVSVGGQQLNPSGGNTISASPAPTFTLSITDGGQTTLSGVQLKVSIQGTSVKGTGTISLVKSNGGTATGTVTLSSEPPTGSNTVVATVVPVHCETNTGNNTLTFPVTFQ